MDKLRGMLGLAAKAGALTSGTNNVLTAVKSGKAKIILLAADASANTAKVVGDKSAFRHVRLCRLSLTMSELGSAVGKGECAAVAILTDDFASFYDRVADTTILGGN